MSGLLPRTRNIWFISDTHFCHENILTFKDDEGRLFRGDKFKSVNDMNVTMIENWNTVIKPQDKVYHLGDAFCGVRNAHVAESIMKALNGHKRLVLGNHDNLQSSYYRHFEKIMLWTGGKFKKEGFVCSHIPLRLDSIRDGEFNVHGHIHQNLIGNDKYINVCVEHTNYKPVHMDDILTHIAAIKNKDGYS